MTSNHIKRNIINFYKQGKLKCKPNYSSCRICIHVRSFFIKLNSKLSVDVFAAHSLRESGGSLSRSRLISKASGGGVVTASRTYRSTGTSCSNNSRGKRRSEQGRCPTLRTTAPRTPSCWVTASGPRRSTDTCRH